MFLPDKPISSKKDDCFDRATFAHLLAKALLNLKTEDTFTVSLYGNWGSGKTSLINMVEESIEKTQEDIDKSEKFKIIHFEPWAFFSADQLLNQFFLRLIGELQSQKDKKLTKIGNLMQKYADAFKLAKAIPTAGSFISYLGAKALKVLGGQLTKKSNETDILKIKVNPDCQRTSL